MTGSELVRDALEQLPHGPAAALAAFIERRHHLRIDPQAVRLLRLICRVKSLAARLPSAAGSPPQRRAA